MRHAASLALALLVLAGCATPGAPGRPPRALTAVGEGRVRVEPDLAVVRLGAEARAERLDDATAEVARRMRAVLGRLAALGVDAARVRTVQYAIEPMTILPRGAADETARIAGYRVTNVVQVEVADVRGVGRVVDAAVAAGANTVPALTLTLADPERARAEARARAVAAASAKARQMATTAGVELGELVELREAGPVPERFDVRTMAVSATGPGPVAPGQLDVTVTVEARYRIR